MGVKGFDADLWNTFKCESRVMPGICINRNAGELRRGRNDILSPSHDSLWLLSPLLCSWLCPSKMTMMAGNKHEKYDWYEKKLLDYSYALIAVWGQYQ